MRIKTEELNPDELKQIEETLSGVRSTKTKEDATKGYKHKKELQPILSSYQPLEFKDPVQFINFVYPTIKLYDWQREELLRLDNPEATARKPLLYNLCAANGSGKDFLVIAGYVGYCLFRYIRCKIVVTSSSYTQLSSQSWPYIRNICEEINTMLGRRVATMAQTPSPNVRCLLTGSDALLFVTDEAKRAEGFHPYPPVPGEPAPRLVLIANEAKSIKDEIFEALDRCTGYTAYIKISSPAGRRGRFYRDCVNERTLHHPEKLELGREYFRRITAYECEHIPKSHIEKKKEELGEHSPWFQSSVLAQFSDFDEMVVISPALVDASYSSVKPNFNSTDKKYLIGLDIGLGKDSTVISAFSGNTQIDLFSFVDRNSSSTVEKIDLRLRSIGLDPTNMDSYQINADGGGIGKAVIDGLIAKGWFINRIYTQTRAETSLSFGNLGFELYFNFGRILENLNLKPNAKLREQLGKRYFEERASRFFLEKKSDARKRSGESPDLADATVLAFRFLWRKFLKIRNKVGTEVANTNGRVSSLELERIYRSGKLFDRKKESDKAPVKSYDMKLFLKPSLTKLPTTFSDFRRKHKLFR